MHDVSGSLLQYNCFEYPYHSRQVAKSIIRLLCRTILCEIIICNDNEVNSFSHQPVELYCHWCIRCVWGYYLISKSFKSSRHRQRRQLRSVLIPSYYNLLIFLTVILTRALGRMTRKSTKSPQSTKERAFLMLQTTGLYLCCVLCKVLESIIFSKIIDFIYPCLSTLQFGFLKGWSCLTRPSCLPSSPKFLILLMVYTPCDVIYLDFRKAFDSIPHPELLYKLWLFGITGPFGFWFRSYLNDRF